jgi:hypothetical protein
MALLQRAPMGIGECGKDRKGRFAFRLLSASRSGRPSPIPRTDPYKRRSEYAGTVASCAAQESTGRGQSQSRSRSPAAPDSGGVIHRTTIEPAASGNAPTAVDSPERGDRRADPSRGFSSPSTCSRHRTPSSPGGQIAESRRSKTTSRKLSFHGALQWARESGSKGDAVQEKQCGSWATRHP